MSDSAAPEPELPIQVQTAASLTRFLAVYAAVMSVPLCLLGSFVGPEILIAGVMHAAIAPVLFYSRKGLLEGRQRATLLLVFLSAFGGLALLVAIVQGWRAGIIDVPGMIFWLAVSLYLSAIAWMLSTTTARAWFTKRR